MTTSWPATEVNLDTPTVRVTFRGVVVIGLVLVALLLLAYAHGSANQCRWAKTHRNADQATQYCGTGAR